MPSARRRIGKNARNMLKAIAWLSVTHCGKTRPSERKNVFKKRRMFVGADYKGTSAKGGCVYCARTGELDKERLARRLKARLRANKADQEEDTTLRIFSRLGVPGDPATVFE
jgi:hypothetical protein